MRENFGKNLFGDKKMCEKINLGNGCGAFICGGSGKISQESIDKITEFAKQLEKKSRKQKKDQK